MLAAPGPDCLVLSVVEEHCIFYDSEGVLEQETPSCQDLHRSWRSGLYCFHCCTPQLILSEPQEYSIAIPLGTTAGCLRLFDLWVHAWGLVLDGGTVNCKV